MVSPSVQGVDLPILVPSLSGEQHEGDSSAISPSCSPERQSRTELSPTSVSADGKDTHSHHSHNIDGREDYQSRSRKLFSSRPKAIFHPRSYEEICAEQAYLSLMLQAHVAQHCDLISKYSLAEAESFQGESRKCKRRARKELGLLRGKLIRVAEQEQAIFARLGELFVEAKSRETWNVAQIQRWQALRGFRRHSHPPNHQEMRLRSRSSLNGATPAFVPQRDLFDHPEYDEGVASTVDPSDNEGSKDDREVSENSLGELLEASSEEPKEKRHLLRRMSGDGYASLLQRDRRLSLPTGLGLA